MLLAVALMAQSLLAQDKLPPLVHVRDPEPTIRLFLRLGQGFEIGTEYGRALFQDDFWYCGACATSAASPVIGLEVQRYLTCDIVTRSRVQLSPQGASVSAAVCWCCPIVEETFVIFSVDPFQGRVGWSVLFLF
jgi:hypothetical protein